MNEQKDYSKIDLDVKHYRNGDPIRFVENPNEWSKLTEGAYCYSSNGSLLYNHYAVMDERGLAPDGFRIPNKDELFNLKDSNFNLNGYRNVNDGSLYDVGSFGFYWSCTVDGTNAWYLKFFSGDADMVNFYRAYGFSVRCLEDNKNTSHDKQTAVEWLWEQIDNTIPFQNIQTSQIFNGLLEQAKEMEKEQILIAYDMGDGDVRYQPEQYYNETYGGNNGKN
jgi:hypothetical protein